MIFFYSLHHQSFGSKVTLGGVLEGREVTAAKAVLSKGIFFLFSKPSFIFWGCTVFAFGCLKLFYDECIKKLVFLLFSVFCLASLGQKFLMTVPSRDLEDVWFFFLLFFSKFFNRVFSPHVLKIMTDNFVTHWVGIKRS